MVDTARSEPLGISLKSSRIKILDGWRAISVLLVIMGHLLSYSTINVTSLNNPIIDAVGLPLLTSIGILGVNIFFVISGFVISNGFLREIEQSNTISLKAFYIRRVYRIIPPLLIYFMSIVILHYAGFIESNRYAVRMLTFTCNFPNADCGGIFGIHTWSLSFEEQFYIVVPFIFSILAIHRKTFINFTTAALTVSISLLYYYGFGGLGGFLSNFLYIFFGVFWSVNRNEIGTYTKILPGWSVYLLILALLLLRRFGMGNFENMGTIVQGLFIFLILEISIIKPTVISRILEFSILQKIGIASYTIYLWQQLATAHYDGWTMPAYLLSIAAVILGAIASQKWIEMPLIRRAAKLSDRIKGGQAHTAPAISA